MLLRYFFLRYVLLRYFLLKISSSEISSSDISFPKVSSSDISSSDISLSKISSSEMSNVLLRNSYQNYSVFSNNLPIIGSYAIFLWKDICIKLSIIFKTLELPCQYLITTLQTLAIRFKVPGAGSQILALLLTFASLNSIPKVGTFMLVFGSLPNICYHVLNIEKSLPIFGRICMFRFKP